MKNRMRLLRVVILLLSTIGAPAVAQAAPKELTPTEQALMQSAFAGKLDAVQKLVADGLPVDTADSEKHTPLMWAAFNGHTSVVRYLLQQGAKVDAKDVNGRTALMYASSGPYSETVELLLQQGAEVNVQGKLEGFTALMTAAAEGQLKVVELLLRYGAERDVTDKDGDTAESFARQKGHTQVVELLENTPPSATPKN